MSGVPVVRMDELEDGVPQLVQVDRNEIALVRWKGRVHAVRNICPHQGASLIAGRARDVLRIDARGLGVLAGECVLACPWHGWEFDVETGRCRLHDRFRLRVYETQVREGVVYILDGRATPATPAT